LIFGVLIRLDLNLNPPVNLINKTEENNTGKTLIKNAYKMIYGSLTLSSTGMNSYIEDKKMMIKNPYAHLILFVIL
jgi:fatty acid/phospholipid biosynthesis enzyme